MKHDIETVCAEIKTVMLDHLNTKLLALDAEKADGVTLAPVDPEAYFFQSLNGRTTNYNPFIFFAIDEIAGVGGDSYTETELSVDVLAVLVDDGQEVDISARMLRYGRALREIFEENWQLPESGVKLIVSSQVPVSVQLLNSPEIHRVIGVKLRAKLG
jgi:hypothetical protein